MKLQRPFFGSIVWGVFWTLLVTGQTVVQATHESVNDVLKEKFSIFQSLLESVDLVDGVLDDGPLSTSIIASV